MPSSLQRTTTGAITNKMKTKQTSAETSNIDQVTTDNKTTAKKRSDDPFGASRERSKARKQQLEPAQVEPAAEATRTRATAVNCNGEN